MSGHELLQGLQVERGSPAVELARDQALLEVVGPGEPLRVRWYVVSQPAVVLGFAQRTRVESLVDRARCRAAGVAVIERQAGGGLVLLDERMVCLSVALALPHPRLPDDLTESYRWLGEAVRDGLRAAGFRGLQVLPVARARQWQAALRARGDGVSAVAAATCFGSPSPYEVFVGQAKLVGLAQVRRRHAALFQAGIPLSDQSALADLARVSDEDTRERVRDELRRSTVGLDTLAGTPVAVEALVRGIHPYVLAAAGAGPDRTGSASRPPARAPATAECSPAVARTVRRSLGP